MYINGLIIGTSTRILINLLGTSTRINNKFRLMCMVHTRLRVYKIYEIYINFRACILLVSYFRFHVHVFVCE